MKKYEELKMEIIAFDSDDIITSSTGDTPGNDEGEGGEGTGDE